MEKMDGASFSIFFNGEALRCVCVGMANRSLVRCNLHTTHKQGVDMHAGIEGDTLDYVLATYRCSYPHRD